MATAPPIARDRLIGLASISPNLVRNMELRGRISPNMEETVVLAELDKIGTLIRRLADADIFPWLENGHQPVKAEIHRAATIVADRLCGAVADPIVRNAQEKRQLASIQDWLEQRGYTHVKAASITGFREMQVGTFAYHLNVPVLLEGGQTRINIPVDVAIMPREKTKDGLPMFVDGRLHEHQQAPKRRGSQDRPVARELWQGHPLRSVPLRLLRQWIPRL
jgi:hypothetical protein